MVFLIAFFPGAITLVQKSGNSWGRLSEFPILTFMRGGAGRYYHDALRLCQCHTEIGPTICKGGKIDDYNSYYYAFDFSGTGRSGQLCHWSVRLLAIVMGSDVPSFMAVQQAIRGMNSFSLMAGPLFILAGEILGAAKTFQTYTGLCRACISQLRGGLGMVSVMANMILPEYQDREPPL